MIDIKTFNEDYKKYQGKRYKLELNSLYAEISPEDFISDDPDYPDYSRYDLEYYDEERDIQEIIIFPDIEYGNKMIQLLKKDLRISDPWDNNPNYMREKKSSLKKDYELKVETALKDESGKYYMLKVSPVYADEESEDFIPEDISYPNAFRYIVYSYDEKNKMQKTVYFNKYDNSYYSWYSFKDDVVKRLKKIHNIVDPWDLDPDYEFLTGTGKTQYEIYCDVEKRRKIKKIPKKMIFGKNQVGERVQKVYHYSCDKEKINEYWLWSKFEYDRKIITWTELNHNGHNILHDRQIVLQRKSGASEKAWRLVSQKSGRKYYLTKEGNKEWVGNKGIELYEEYTEEDNIKVRFADNRIEKLFDKIVNIFRSTK